MSVNTQQVTVTTSAVRLDPVAGGARMSCAVRNRGSVPVFLGSSTVTSSTGFQLDAGETFTADLRGVDALYGITAAGTGPATCHVLQVSGN